MPLKTVVKKHLPDRVILEIRQIRMKNAMQRLLRNWGNAVDKTVSRPISRPLQRLLIVPSDPNTLTGALGDDAMISACVEQAQALNPHVAIHTLTSQPEASSQAERSGYIAEQIWQERDFPAAVLDLLQRRGFDAVAALGADIMDGYYDPVSAAQTLVTCDLASRSGVPTTVLGFSFNAKPDPQILRVFARLHAGVRLHLRDTLSLDRLKAAVNVQATLVSDSAFSLGTAPAPEEIATWIKAQRADNRRVVGINVHPMLFESVTEEQVALIIQRVSEGLSQVSECRSVAWLLMPHDYRGERGDSRCLQPIAERLAPTLGDSIQMLCGEHRAAVLKGVAELLDGVVTGRMHLAIASLGKGVPTLSITYQDKFEGLYRHFSLPEWLLMNPKTLLEHGEVAERLKLFIDNLESIKHATKAVLPSVLSLSRENFSAFD